MYLGDPVNFSNFPAFPPRLGNHPLTWMVTKLLAPDSPVESRSSWWPSLHEKHGSSFGQMASLTVIFACCWVNFTMSYHKLVSLHLFRHSSLRRCFSTRRQDETIMNVFDRKAKRRQKNRAALAENVAVYDYLKDEVWKWMILFLTVVKFYLVSIAVWCFPFILG